MISPLCRVARENGHLHREGGANSATRRNPRKLEIYKEDGRTSQEYPWTKEADKMDEKKKKGKRCIVQSKV